MFKSKTFSYLGLIIKDSVVLNACLRGLKKHFEFLKKEINLN